MKSGLEIFSAKMNEIELIILPDLEFLYISSNQYRTVRIFSITQLSHMPWDTLPIPIIYGLPF